MTKQLKIAKDFSLPLEAVTQTFAILAKRGVGKTYTASVMVEEMLKAGLRVVVVDPIGVWWGLRASADKQSEGLQIIIAGGDHADVPIEPSSGEVLANFVIQNQLPVLLDLSHFRKNQQTQFMTDFAETLYHSNREALHLVIDEADAFAPQRTFRGQERMLGAIEDLVRRGRARGIGVTLITQRPAVLNKNVLTQIEVLVTLRLIAPQDRAAINEWIKVHGTPEQEKELMGSLPSLPVGTAWMWSAGWLDVFQKVQIRERETFDSSSTPKVGEQYTEPKKLAEVDLEEIKQRLAGTIQKVEADDPAVLRRRIAELERELQQKQPEVKVERVTLEVLPQGFNEAVNDAIDGAQELFDGLVKLREFCKDYTEGDPPDPMSTPQQSYVAPMSTPKPANVNTENGELSKYAQGLLEVIAAHDPMRMTKSQLSVLSGRKPRSSAFSKAISDLWRGGYINDAMGEFELTDKARAELGQHRQAPKSRDEIIQKWQEALPPYERELFDTILDHAPNTITKQQLSELTGRSITSSGFHRALSTLEKNGLIGKEGDQVAISTEVWNII